MFVIVPIFKLNFPMAIDIQELFADIKGKDEKSIYALLRALKHNFDANTFDYFKFKQSVASLTQMDMDLSTSYKSAFATAATMGLTKDKLIKSAKKYINVLENERESFAAALIARKNEKIDGRKLEVSELGNKIESHKAKILELQREIEIFQGRIDSVDQDVEDATTKIEGTKQKFLGVYNVLADNISKDIESFNNYL